MTTMSRLLGARDIVDLWEHDNARDRLWRALRTRGIRAHRDYMIKEGALYYRADLALPMPRQGMVIECIADVAMPLALERAMYDPWDRIMAEHGWFLQCFSTAEILADIDACVEIVGRYVESNTNDAPLTSVA
jgi:very-short-patch-repair endonuclease